MDIIELQSEKPKPSFDFKPARTPGRFIFQAKDLQIGYDRPLTQPLIWLWTQSEGSDYRGKRDWENNLLKSLLGISHLSQVKLREGTI